MARLLTPKLGASLAHYFPWLRQASTKTAAGGTTTSRALLVEALDRLNDKLAAAGETIKLWMIGGGVMMLALKAFSLREGTRDLQDLRFLMQAVGLKSLDHLYDILERYQDIEFLQDGDDIIIENMAREVLGKPLLKA